MVCFKNTSILFHRLSFGLIGSSSNEQKRLVVLEGKTPPPRSVDPVNKKKAKQKLRNSGKTKNVRNIYRNLTAPFPGKDINP